MKNKKKFFEEKRKIWQERLAKTNAKPSPLTEEDRARLMNIDSARRSRLSALRTGASQDERRMAGGIY